MEKDRVQKQHRCRICQKSFPCGRSLGGHMRSHSVSSDAEKGKKLIEKIEEKEKKPNKTWRRLSGEASKPCGKEFPSWKALYGQMRCHSDKTFWRCFEAGHEQEGDSVPIAAAASSSEYEPDQEDVAISLMMLSRDVGGACWISSATELSDEQSVFLEEDDLNRSNEAEDAGDESGKKRNNLNAAEFVKKGDENSNGFNAFEAKMAKDELKLESRYQCAACNRTFHSYQALGGHRASHKRIRGCCLMKIDVDASAHQLTAMMDNDSLSGLSKKKSRSIHECSICKRTFSSGQALGGHKRSHLNGDGGGHSHPELLDLNLPAPVEDEEELSNVKPWWAGESFKHQRALVDLISN